MIYGYARVSTDGQSVEAQVTALTTAGAEKVFREVASGAKTDRAQLRRALDALSPGDVLMVMRLDRLARSTRDLLNSLRRSPASKPDSVRSATHGPTPPRRTAALCSPCSAVWRNSNAT
jgi:predicted site-specific integrase-resolvase